MITQLLSNNQNLTITQAASMAQIALEANNIGAQTVGAVIVPTDKTPSGKVFASTAVNTGTSTVTITGHGFVTGLVGQLTTTGGLPSGLSTSTNYYIIVVDANTVAFASSLSNANAGTKITLSTQGSGNDTFTATSLSGATAVWQVSQDGSTWANWASPTSLTAGTNIVMNPPVAMPPGYNQIRMTFALTAGQLQVQVQTVTKG